MIVKTEHKKLMQGKGRTDGTSTQVLQDPKAGRTARPWTQGKDALEQMELALKFFETLRS